MFDRVLNTSLYLHIHANKMHNRQGICTGSVSIIILFSFSRNKERLISYKNFKLGKNKVTKQSFDPNFPLDINQLCCCKWAIRVECFAMFGKMEKRYHYIP